MNTLKLLIMLSAICIMAEGCSTNQMMKSKRDVCFDKKVEGDIEVQIFGINSSEDAYWRKIVRPDDFWDNVTTGNEVVNPKSITFGQGDAYVLHNDDPIWNAWIGSGATELIIFANLPGIHSNDENDPRRLIIPLSPKQTRPLHVEIYSSRLHAFAPE